MLWMPIWTVEPCMMQTCVECGSIYDYLFEFIFEAVACSTYLNRGFVASSLEGDGAGIFVGLRNSLMGGKRF